MSHSFPLADLPAELLDHIIGFLPPRRDATLADVFRALFPLTATCRAIRPLAERMMRVLILARPGIYAMDVAVYLARYTGRRDGRPAVTTAIADEKFFFRRMPAALLGDLVRSGHVKKIEVHARPRVAGRLLGVCVDMGLCVWGKVYTTYPLVRGRNYCYPWVVIYGIQIPTEDDRGLAEAVYARLDRADIKPLYRDIIDGTVVYSYRAVLMECP